MRADLVGAALLEAVAGLAGAGRLLALGDVGLGQALDDRRVFGGGRSASGGGRLGARQVVAGHGGLVGGEHDAGHHLEPHHHQQGGEQRAGDFVGLDIHRIRTLEPAALTIAETRLRSAGAWKGSSLGCCLTALRARLQLV